jgi:beta-lactamase superfamily II metal-dependent hydrolase
MAMDKTKRAEMIDQCLDVAESTDTVFRPDKQEFRDKKGTFLAKVHPEHVIIQIGENDFSTHSSLVQRLENCGFDIAIEKEGGT